MFTILSFVGGGIRGLMSATMLQNLFGDHMDLLDGTDLLAGCSTGSVIVSELVAGRTPADLVTLFTGPEIGFYDKQNLNAEKPAYPIDEVILSQKELHGDMRLSQLKRKVLFLSFNVGGSTTDVDGILVPIPWRPILFTNMTSETAETEVAIAASSSGAMPGQLGSVEGNVDGAFFNHDPTIPAIALAVSHGVPLEEIAVICFGTGLMYDWITSDTHTWGAKQWMNGDGNPFNNTPPFLMNQTTPSPVLDLCLNGTSTELMPMLAGMLLGPDRYVNLNPTLPCFIPENSTSPADIQLLQDKGNDQPLEQARLMRDLYWEPPILGPGGEQSGTA